MIHSDIKVLIIGALGAVVIGSTALYLIITPVAPSMQSQNANITWSVSRLSETMFPGTSSTTIMSFRSDHDLPDIVIDLAPSIKEIAIVTPSSISPVVAGKDYQLTLTFTAPPEFRKRSFNGTVQVKNLDIPPKVYGTPFNVNLRTDWKTLTDASTGIALSVPLLPDSLSLSQLPSNDGSIMLDIYRITDEGRAQSMIRLTVFTNPGRSDLTAWFHERIDPTGVLIGSKTYQENFLDNGLVALVRVAPFPDEYKGGPVSVVYAMTANLERIVSISQSQEAQLSAYGYNASEVRTILKSIVGSIQGL